MDIYYGPTNERENGIFTFTLSEIEAVITERLRNLPARLKGMPHSATQPETDWLQCQIEALQKVKEPGEFHWDQWLPELHPEQIVEALIERGRGVVWCAECNAVYKTKKLVAFDWWQWSFGGILYVCPQDHVLFCWIKKFGGAQENPPAFTRWLHSREASQARASQGTGN